ncbi:hypothetical protein GGR51DRAFT_84981 [Nemania sp. FL0031]|nr:hypothetical protein GGR51DRAFT_84981 [Nemania sp. FL0031]
MMASAAMHYSVDKDPSQLSLWPDNDELPVTTDHFFDQYLTFDTGDAAVLGGEVLENPPSPSILLESLGNEPGSSASGALDLPPDSSHDETSVTPTSQPVSVEAESTLVNPVETDPTVPIALAGDPILSTGSISDSELLHLEGISLHSSPPRRNATAPSTPPFATAPLSPHKRSRFVESYATIRRAPPRPRPVKQEEHLQIDMADLDAFLADPKTGLDIFDVNYDEFVSPTEPMTQEPIGSNGLPVTPPLSSRIGFITGSLDDPFCDDVIDTSAILSPAKHPDISTPIDTPVINGEAFLANHVAAPANTNMNSFRQPQKAYRSTSSAEWPMEGLLTDLKFDDDASFWSSAPSSAVYMSDNGNGGTIASPSWWEPPQAGELSHPEPSRHRSTNGNAAHNIAMHGQQADLPYEFNADMSGLMIHMPQPRTPQAAVLSLNDHVLATPNGPSSGYHVQRTPILGRSHGHNFQHPHGSSKMHGHTDRRPRPRAPSSGARHHGGAHTSPRKLHHSASLGCLREEPPSPSPMSRHGHSYGHGGPHHHSSGSSNGSSHHHQDRRQHRSSSLTMRKQRSFSRRSTNSESRATSSGSASATFAAGTPGSSGARGGVVGGTGEGFVVDFVNYTPNNGRELMSGVAPSGSSKTKARREKEALERSRLNIELALKVAGADMNPGVLKELMDSQLAMTQT